MDAVARFFELFNAKDFGAMGALMAFGYSYAEPMFPEPRDADAHLALMEQVATASPDRRVDVRRRVPGAGGAAVEATWRGTPAQGREPLTLECVFVFDLEDGSGAISRLRGYYELPG